MLLKDYLEKYKIDRTKFSADCGIPYSTLMYYASKKGVPTQKRAELIEKFSDGAVTVKDMRGLDDRDKPR